MSRGEDSEHTENPASCYNRWSADEDDSQHEKRFFKCADIGLSERTTVCTAIVMWML